MTAYYATLEREALLHISGPDTLTFLQGQTTCDTREVSPEQAVPGAYCTPQGRMVCDFLLGQLGSEHFGLRLRADTLDSSAAAFGKYIVFSKADVDTARKDWRVIACWGETVGTALQEVFAELPEAPYQAVSGDGYLLIRLDEAGEAFEIWLNTESHPETLQAIGNAMSQGDENDWEALRIRGGHARVENANVEELLPQMLNYDLSGHISFNKGCYTGQEIVARLHYRGKAKRRLFFARGGDALPAGTPLFAPGREQSVGTVVNSAGAEGGAVHLLSSTEAALDAPLHPESPDSPVALTSSPLHTETE